MNFSGVDLGLLRFCLDHDDSGKGGEGLPPRDPADFEWLKKVLNSISTPPERMKKCISLLHNKDSVLEDRITALTELQFYAEDIDCANDLAKMGIGEVALAMMAQPPAGASKEEEEQFVEIREMACWVVASMLQNNPQAQAQLLAQGIPHILLAVLSQETQPRVLAKALSAVSGLIRDFPAGQRAVLQEGKDGRWLGRTLLDGRLQLRTKTAVLAKHLASAGPSSAGLLLQGDFLARLLRCLGSDLDDFWTDSGEIGQPNDSTLREQTLETLLALVNHALPSTSSSSSSSPSSSSSSDNGDYIRRLQSKLSEVNLNEVVQSRVRQLEGQQNGEDAETELSLYQTLSSALSDLAKVQV